MRNWIFIALIFFGFSSCRFQSEEDNGKITIVATTSILADGIRNLVGDQAEVISLMPAGVDPHLYKASVRDLDLLENADLVIYHGLYLEGKMTEIFEKLAFSKDLINVSETIPDSLLLRAGPEAHSVDPHIWFDVNLWKLAMQHASEEIIKWKPEWTKKTEELSRSYQKQLDELNLEVQQKTKQLNESNQALITAHDAFAYFGKAYHIEVKGLQGLSTLSEPGLRDLTGLIQFIIDRNIHAVFAEQTISPKAITAVVAGCANAGHSIKLAGPLYTDSLDSPHTPAGTYIGMVETNLKTIFDSLQP
jgi:manganese/zinc/iron transport system substrate-binding protein